MFVYVTNFKIKLQFLIVPLSSTAIQRYLRLNDRCRGIITVFFVMEQKKNNIESERQQKFERKATKLREGRRARKARDTECNESKEWGRHTISTIFYIIVRTCRVGDGMWREMRMSGEKEHIEERQWTLANCFQETLGDLLWRRDCNSV